MQAYSPPPSLWKLVEQQVPPHEQEEIKSMLGPSLVDQSLELHEEVEMLLDIWREMKTDEAESNFAFTQGLPEPPNLRDRLVQEICFFVDNVKEKAKEKGVDPHHILKQHRSDVLDYAMQQSRPGTSCGRTSRCSDGRETPMMVASPDRLLVSNEMTSELEAANKQLNYLEFDQVCSNLRNTLVKEVEQLLKDVQFLQTCLDTEADIRDCVTPRLTSREPTLTELREERSSLEKDLLATDMMKATPVVTKASFNANTRILPSTPPSLPTTPPGPTAVTAVPQRGAPLRANHNILTLTYQDSESKDSCKPSAASSSLIKPTKKLPAPPVLPSTPRVSTKDGTLPKSTPQPVSHKLGLSQLRNQTEHLSVSETGLAHKTQPERARRRNISPARRTVSPGRVQVVDVTNIVDAHLHRGDSAKGHSDLPLSASSSSSASTFLPTPPPGERDRTLRPGSAHADRFRKMVTECRDLD